MTKKTNPIDAEFRQVICEELVVGQPGLASCAHITSSPDGGIYIRVHDSNSQDRIAIAFEPPDSCTISLLGPDGPRISIASKEDNYGIVCVGPNFDRKEIWAHHTDD